jgi:hypothetical protein
MRGVIIARTTTTCSTSTARIDALCYRRPRPNYLSIRRVHQSESIVWSKAIIEDSNPGIVVWRPKYILILSQKYLFLSIKVKNLHLCQPHNH